MIMLGFLNPIFSIANVIPPKLAKVPPACKSFGKVFSKLIIWETTYLHIFSAATKWSGVGISGISGRKFSFSKLFIEFTSVL